MRKLFFALIMILSTMLSACTIADSNIQDKIISPVNNTPPIEGKWTIDESIRSLRDEEKLDDIAIDGLDDKYLGREVLFNNEAVVVGDDYANNPIYRLKNVNTKDYLLYKYKINPSSLNIESENVQIITVLKDNHVFYEFVRYDEDNLLIFIDNIFYRLSRVVDKVSSEEVNRYISIENSMVRSFSAVGSNNMDSGILLGIKTPIYDEEKDIPNWEYKTIWIRSEGRNITKYELDKLLVPRSNGFWLLGMSREDANSSIEDKVMAIPQFTSKSKKNFDEEVMITRIENEAMVARTNKPSILKSINFIGNDYISLEKIETDNKDKKTLGIYTIDNIHDDTPLKLSDIIGEEGKFLFKEGSENLHLLGESAVITNESNIGLTRKNGYWVLKGRVNYRQNEEELYKDFNIRAIPPNIMVRYDELSVTWDKISTQLPGAVDAFSSPNMDFVIVLRAGELQVYPTDAGEITNLEPMAKINIPDNSSVIMSEWALDRYPAIWENEMINQGAKYIE